MDQAGRIHMTLIEKTLFGTTDKVQVSMDRIKTLAPKDGYYLAFSGGKDSIVILDLAKRSETKFDAHYQHTTVDPPELVRFIRSEFPEVQRHLPEKTMWRLIVENKKLPTRNARYCCKYLKEVGGSGRVVLTGLRWAESIRRRQRRMTETCMRDSTKTYIHPIIDWSNEDVWEYIREFNLKYCSLYDEGWKRIGCVMCPYSNRKKEALRWPKLCDAYKRALIKARIEREKKIGGEFGKIFSTFEEEWDWWINDKRVNKDTDQISMFE